MIREMSEANIEDTLAWLQRMQFELRSLQSGGEPLTVAISDGSRLSLERVTLSAARHTFKISVTIKDGSGGYCGESTSATAEASSRLAAEAALDALNSYLESLPERFRTGKPQLLEAGGFRLASGERAVYVNLEFADKGDNRRVIGAVLEGDSPLLAAAAAVLDAVNRRIAPCGIQQTLERIAVSPSDGEAAAQAPAEVLPSMGIHLTSGAVRAALVDSDGKIFAQAMRPCVSTAIPETVIYQMSSAVQEVLSANGRDSRICGIGIALAGRHRQGVCLESSEFSEWQEVPLAELACQQFGKPLLLIDEAKAALIAEGRLGAGAGLRNLLFFSSGPRLACALMLEGKVLEGASGAFAKATHLTLPDYSPKIGEDTSAVCTCGQINCWQSLSTDSALILKAKNRISQGEKSAVLEFTEGEPSSFTSGLLFRAAEAGDSLAREVLKEGAFWVGRGLLKLIELCDPEAVIVSGPSLPDEAWMVHLRASLASQPAGRRCPLLSARLGRDGPIIGAALLAREISP
jgi:glucokinase